METNPGTHGMGREGQVYRQADQNGMYRAVLEPAIL